MHKCESCALNLFCDDCKDEQGKRKTVEECGDFIPRLQTRQKIRIEGYFKDDKMLLDVIVCINDMSVGEDDEQIFFYFENWGEVDGACKEETAGEFVITSIAPEKEA